MWGKKERLSVVRGGFGGWPGFGVSGFGLLGPLGLLGLVVPAFQKNKQEVLWTTEGGASGITQRRGRLRYAQDSEE